MLLSVVWRTGVHVVPRDRQPSALLADCVEHRVASTLVVPTVLAALAAEQAGTPATAARSAPARPRRRADDHVDGA